MRRRDFLMGLAAGAISTMDWLRYFREYGVPGTKKQLGMAEAAAAESTDPHYLIYWNQEGGWDGYSMFNVINRPNDINDLVNGANGQLLRPDGVKMIKSYSDQCYAATGYGVAPQNLPKVQGNIPYGFLAQGGTSLMGDMAVVASHIGNQFHSGGRWDYHYGKYATYAPLSAMRQPDERTVMQAFCEAYGASYLLPHVSWHNWLSDGELSAANYPEGTGYYENLGPAWAHTIYGGTPSSMRNRLLQIQATSSNARAGRIRQFVDNLQDNFVADKNSESVQAFASALGIYRSQVGATVNFDPNSLFTSTDLLSAFNVQPADELTSSASINGNPARSKQSPKTNVQAMMTFELMRQGLSCGFFIESRDIRAFDSHRGRSGVAGSQGEYNQLQLMQDNLWSPLQALVNQLKNTQHPVTKQPYWNHTNIVLISEMGRTMNTDANPILADGTLTDDAKLAQIMDQDVCQHWFVSGAAFLGGSVRGNAAFGKAVWPLNYTVDDQGAQHFLGSIPMQPDGTLDPAYDSTTGMPIAGRTPNVNSVISDAGHIYSTALYLSGLDPASLLAQSKGRNNRPPLTFIKK